MISVGWQSGHSLSLTREKKAFLRPWDIATMTLTTFATLISGLSNSPPLITVDSGTAAWVTKLRVAGLDFEELWKHKWTDTEYNCKCSANANCNVGFCDASKSIESIRFSEAVIHQCLSTLSPETMAKMVYQVEAGPPRM